MNRIFIEKEANLPQEDFVYRAAAKACQEQRAKIGFLKNEQEETEAFLSGCAFLPLAFRESVGVFYADALDEARAEYGRRRMVLLEMGCDDFD